jgi:hypothetical protein
MNAWSLASTQNPLPVDPDACSILVVRPSDSQLKIILYLLFITKLWHNVIMFKLIWKELE